MNLKRRRISRSSLIRVGITMGDPSGIGPLIIAKALKIIDKPARFYIIGDRWVFSKSLKICQLELKDINFIDLNNVNHRYFRFGKIKSEYGRASIEYLDRALELIRAKKIDCLVTCPISKKAINLAGFPYVGHTEYFSSNFNNQDLVMMLLNNKLKISLVTRHLPLRDVPSTLTQDKIYKTTLLSYKALKKLFLIKEPHLVICGLNPHASDNGLLGNEEERIIKPAVKNLKRIIKYIDGPLPSDVAISRTYQKQYDCVVAMYHDQALIPLKLLSYEIGVNLTLGLDFIRTSPLHGTAFDIAGTELADPSSLIAAIKLAIQCTLNLRRV
ncbi:MAG: 4-hydroxythreonine-4-phosphate dehydrogenase PdxA [Candidatus Omnitrophica bacterium]|nr:4-hydroxythreonine-4-phosphate dehydrogenase PdxA [Candidatus Omnitrophota bacterium]